MITDSVCDQIEAILAKYGDPPRQGELNHIANKKILECIQEMDRRIEELQNDPVFGWKEAPE